MRSFLIRVEGVNLANFIYDTTDLATIRGAGLLLLNMPRMLQGLSDEGEATVNTGLFRTPDGGDIEFDPCSLPGSFSSRPSSAVSLEVVTEGASTVVYRCELKDESDAESLVRCIERYLKRHEQLRFATFAVACALESGDYQRDLETLLARTRCSQMRKMDLIIGRGNERRFTNGGGTEGDDHEIRYCDVDALRPGTYSTKAGGSGVIDDPYARAENKNWICESTKHRRAYGRKAKVRLYRMLGKPLDSSEPFIPTWNFEELTGRNEDDAPREGQPGPGDRLADLAHKMAIIYIDGNKFGALQRRVATTIENQRSFDNEIRDLRRKLMGALVDKIQKSPQWQAAPSAAAQQLYQKEPEAGMPSALPWQARIETLMWGGDELIWAVPAWCAVDALLFFFEQTRDWREPIQQTQLTHAVGMVLCAHNAPIRSTVELARNLADHAKDQLQTLAKRRPELNRACQPPAHSPVGNVVAYEILESFDHLGRDFLVARRERRFPRLEDVDLLLPAADFERFVQILRRFKSSEGLPTRRLYQIANLLHRKERCEEDLKNLVRRIEATAGVDLEAMEKDRSAAGEFSASQLFASPEAKWHHLIELWRYVPAE